jgi:hypothetical protein
LGPFGDIEFNPVSFIMVGGKHSHPVAVMVKRIETTARLGVI